MNITVTIEAPELVGALNNLANAFGNANPLEGVQINKPLETQVPEETPAPKEATAPKEEKSEKEAPEVATKTQYFVHDGTGDVVVVKKGESLEFLERDIFDPISKAEYDKRLKANEDLEASLNKPQEEFKSEPESTPSISLDTLTTKTRKFVQGNPENRKKLKGFLEEMGVPKISELPPAEYAAAIKFMESNGE